MTSISDNGLRTFHIASVYLIKNPAGGILLVRYSTIKYKLVYQYLRKMTAVQYLTQVNFYYFTNISLSLFFFFWSFWLLYWSNSIAFVGCSTKYQLGLGREVMIVNSKFVCSYIEFFVYTVRGTLVEKGGGRGICQIPKKKVLNYKYSLSKSIYPYVLLLSKFVFYIINKQASFFLT